MKTFLTSSCFYLLLSFLFINFADYWTKLLGFTTIKHKEDCLIVSCDEKKKVLLICFCYSCRNYHFLKMKSYYDVWLIVLENNMNLLQKIRFLLMFCALFFFNRRYQFELEWSFNVKIDRRTGFGRIAFSIPAKKVCYFLRI